MSLVLVGFMGAGKTTAARRLDGAAVDADAVLEAELGEPIAAFFDREGEAAFRAREEEVVLRLLEGERTAVLALGGGAVESPRVRAALRAHDVALVDCDLETAWARASAGGERPLARDRGAFAARFAARAPLYEEVAALRLLWDGPHPVWLGPLARAPWPAPGRRFVVSDETVADLHVGVLDDVAGLVEIPPGEPHKTLATCERVWRALVEQGATRADHVVALGGGVVGDLAGFVAATYQRGVPVVQVPTTLVAMVDSAIGGKTGVDLPGAKNMVGAYHQPAGVLCDPAFLATLPAAELAAGYAEVVKTALIAGGPLWERVRAGGPLDDAVIAGCVRTKLRVVAEDERDGGRRQVLNLGHTVGHALEAVTGFGRLRHGEAVALGLLAALRLSGLDALREEVRALLAAAGLPTAIDGVEPEAVVAATARDKKRLGTGPVPFVLVRSPGDVVHGQAVDEPAVLAAVRELGSGG
jgi:shikimate kinase / 3-dehydroquinate synthase